MFCQSTIPISEDTLTYISPILAVGRVLGLFPVVVIKKKNKYHLKWSFLFAVYSCTLGIAIPFFTYRGLLKDIQQDDKLAIKASSTTNVYVAICDITVLALAISIGIFSSVFSRSDFFYFIKCINKMERIMPVRNTKMLMKRSMVMLGVILASIGLVVAADINMHLHVHTHITKSFLFDCYAAYYTTYFVLIMNQFKFYNLSYYVLIRLRDFNRCLKPERILGLVKHMEDHKETSSVLTKDKKKLEGYAQAIINSHGGITNKIVRFQVFYENLCDAVDCLNRLYGIINAVTIIGTIWHLIETPYFLVLEVSGSRRDLAVIGVLSLWCLLHAGQIILTIEPCYACLLEVKKSHILTSKLLLDKDVHPDIKHQLRDLSTLMLNCKFEFSAGGLTMINRELFTAVLEAVLTYLVIVLEFELADSSLKSFNGTATAIRPQQNLSDVFI